MSIKKKINKYQDEDASWLVKDFLTVFYTKLFEGLISHLKWIGGWLFVSLCIPVIRRNACNKDYQTPSLGLLLLTF